MKKALEAALVVAALVLAAFVVRQWRERRALAARPAAGPSAAPGTDAEGPPSARLNAPRAGAVAAIPMVKLSSPPRAPRREPVVPAPPAK